MTATAEHELTLDRDLMRATCVDLRHQLDDSRRETDSLKLQLKKSEVQSDHWQGEYELLLWRTTRKA